MSNKPGFDMSNAEYYAADMMSQVGDSGFIDDYEICDCDEQLAIDISDILRKNEFCFRITKVDEDIWSFRITARKGSVERMRLKIDYPHIFLADLVEEKILNDPRYEVEANGFLVDQFIEEVFNLTRLIQGNLHREDVIQTMNVLRGRGFLCPLQSFELDDNQCDYIYVRQVQNHRAGNR